MGYTKVMTNEEITNYIFLDDADQSGDIGFVFGTWNAFYDACKKAAEVCNKGLVPKLVVSGGVNKRSGLNEGDLMAQEIMKQGVSQGDIFNENKSTNTLENVLFSKEILDQKIGLNTIHIIVAIAKNIHMRRALMTLKRHMPSSITLKAAAYPSAYYGNITKENWYQSDVGRGYVVKELEKIKMYLAKGDLVEL